MKQGFVARNRTFDSYAVEVRSVRAVIATVGAGWFFVTSVYPYRSLMPTISSSVHFFNQFHCGQSTVEEGLGVADDLPKRDIVESGQFLHYRSGQVVIGA